MFKHTLSIGLWVTMAISSSAAADVSVIHAGKVLVIPGEEPLTEQTIVVRDDRIERVQAGYLTSSEVDAKAKLINLKDSFVLPGLMDMHVHLLGELSKTSRTDALFVTTSMEALSGAYYAKKTLDAGFTTVRDLGANPEAIYALRAAVKKGHVPGPRIFAAGSALAATGGHGDIDGIKPELLKL